MKSSLAQPTESKPSPVPPSPANDSWGRITRRVAGLFRSFGSQPAGDAAAPDLDALFAFPSETNLQLEQVPKTEVATARKSGTGVPVPMSSYGPVVVLVVAAVVGLGVIAIRRLPISQYLSRQPQQGHLTVDSRGAGLEVLVDGQLRGTTPVTVAIATGPHTITVRNGTDVRVVPLSIVAGAAVSQYFDMTSPAEPKATSGGVSVVTDPPGARVTVDGRPHGVSPVVVTDLTAGEHAINVANETGSAAGTIAVTAGSTASLVFSLSKIPGPVGGWLSIAAPFAVDVIEHNDLVGSSGASRIMMATGAHDLIFTNRSIGYEVTRRVEVAAGNTTKIRLDAPKVSVSVNARPWADIFLDGTVVGQTPISNLLVGIGPHEVLFRNPQFAERKQTLVVTVTGPNRIAADLTR